jgi:hypothetical protein
MSTQNKNKVECPDEMTCDQMGRYKTFRIFQDVKIAYGYAKKTNGQIYTQVDGDTDVVYSKGIHYVNRTGVYAVIK